MPSDPCKACEQPEVFCVCPPSPGDTIAVAGVVIILAAFLVLLLVVNTRPKIIQYRQGYDRPQILGPDPLRDDEENRVYEQIDDPDPPYDVDEQPT